MKDKAYIVVVILGIIAAVMVVWATFMLNNASRKVDCDAILRDQNGVDLRPIPKQCKKGE